MADLPNGFTGFAGRRDDDFESAGEASRRLQEALAAGNGVPGPSTDSPIADSILGGAHQRGVISHSKVGRHAASQPRENAQRRAEVPHQGVARHQAVSASGFAQRLDSASSAGVSEIDQRWAWLEVDLAAIRHNVAETRRYLEPRTRLMAVVAADAYGHGAVECSKAMLAAGVDRLAVATVAEGVALREVGITAPIMLLEQPPRANIPLLVAHHIVPAVYEPDFAVAYGEAADLRGATAPYHLALNTGMNRIGVSFRDAAEFLHQVSFHRALELEGTFTQFATASDTETLEFNRALARFDEAIALMRGAGFDPGIVHAANSAATFRFRAAHFDMVRCGLALYGVQPCEATRDRLDIQPAMSVHARVSDTHVVPMSEGVSYGYRYRSPGSVKICTVPLGFADGLRRGLSGKIDFIVGGQYHPQVGEICMGQSMFEIDLRNRRNLSCDPQVGDHVLIVGEEGAAQVTIDELAEKAKTTPYEMLVGFGARLTRVYA